MSVFFVLLKSSPSYPIPSSLAHIYNLYGEFKPPYGQGLTFYRELFFYKKKVLGFQALEGRLAKVGQ